MTQSRLPLPAPRVDLPSTLQEYYEHPTHIYVSPVPRNWRRIVLEVAGCGLVATAFAWAFVQAIRWEVLR